MYVWSYVCMWMIGNENFTSQESGDRCWWSQVSRRSYVNATIPMHPPTCGRVLYSIGWFCHKHRITKRQKSHALVIMVALEWHLSLMKAAVSLQNVYFSLMFWQTLISTCVIPPSPHPHLCHLVHSTVLPRVLMSTCFVMHQCTKTSGELKGATDNLDSEVLHY